jgi:SAM-dependent methyltransferase
MARAPANTIGALERVVPDEAFSESWVAVHVARYDFAAHYARCEGRLLDIACGSGHGTALLAGQLANVECYGVDLDADAIAIAGTRYAKPNAQFVQGNALTFEDRAGFDTIISLETIEHLDHPRRFVEGLVRMLKPHGRLIASVPSTPSTDANPYHRHDFTEQSFARLFTRHGLREVASLRLVDPFTNTPAFTRGDVVRGAILRRMLRHYVSHPRSLVRRIGATLRYGFENRYIITAWERTHR